MTGKLILAALALVLAAAAPARAVNVNAGTSGAQFLKLGAGSRAGAMGDAVSAVVDDAYAVYYNPAALQRLTGTQLAGAHTSYVEGSSYEVLTAAYPFDRYTDYSRHALGFGIYQMSVGDIQRRVSDSTDPVGTFDASDSAYALSYAYAIDRRLAAGVTGKYIHQSLDSYSATAFAADAGLLYRANPDGDRPFSAAFVLRNVGTKPSFAGQADPLPASVTLGAGYQPSDRVVLTLEASKYRDSNPFVAGGVELTHPFSEGVSGALRGGYNTHRLDGAGTFNGVSLGGGLRFQKAAFDFAWVPFGDLGDTFRYSLTIKF